MIRSRGYDPFACSLYQDKMLDAMLNMCIVQDNKRSPVAVFDLDGCLFDTRYRQIMIFRALGNADAHHNLGVFYRDGVGVAKDPVNALHYLGMAASMGHPRSLLTVALALTDHTSWLAEAGRDRRLKGGERTVLSYIRKHSSFSAQIYFGDNEV